MRLPKLFSLFSICLLFAISTQAKSKPKQVYYQLEAYYFSTGQQEAIIDNYLTSAYLPALHGHGLKNIGVFKPIANDTAVTKVVYILIPFSSWQHIETIGNKLKTNQEYITKASAFLGAPFDAPAFKRKEVTLIRAFTLAPKLELPVLTAPLNERVYELRSYESATDNLFQSKVHMFNEGGEVGLFKKLGFNAIFYGEVVAGAKMPNLVYMTSFNNMDDRNKHWETFGKDPEWKTLSGKSMYQHTVSKADIILTKAAPYSDY